ncbi:MAG TPA: SRPBCC family protein [Pyrinomonadaceae bacterium]
MATRRQEIRTQTGGERQEQFTGASSSQASQSSQRGSQKTRDASPRTNENGNGQQGARLKNVKAERLARGLGWFSIGLGLAELLAPRGIARVAGVRGNTTLIRLLGLREIAHGIAIFTQDNKTGKPAEAVWSRVAGDALDLACLGAAFASPKTNKGRVAFATANVLAVTALDVLCARQLSSNNGATKGGTNQVKKSIIINRTPEEVYQFWRDLQNLPRFMNQLESVTETGDDSSHWVAKAPAGTIVEWDAVITEDRVNERIVWRSLEGADVDNSGSVEFETAPGGRGTIVRVEIEYNPPGGVIGEWIAKLTGDDPGQQAQEALRCLKQVLETGEVVLSDGTFWDNGLLTQRPAQPVSGEELQRAQGADSRAASS